MSGLSDNLLERYRELRPAITARLEEFACVPEEEYFYELCFCLLTPQSKALNALQAVERLKAMRFRESSFNPVEILRSQDYYIRFHNQKAARLAALQRNFPKLLADLLSIAAPNEKRLLLVKNVSGLGMKEASHFLRNTGVRGMAILDRHILKHLYDCGAITEIPKTMTEEKYIEIEIIFADFARSVGISIDELDLLFWSAETGIILK